MTSTSTSWEELANKHLGHKAKLLDHKHLRCFECAMTLVLPRETHGALTPTPPQFDHTPRPDLVPMPAGLKERTLAEIAARRRAKQDGAA